MKDPQFPVISIHAINIPPGFFDTSNDTATITATATIENLPYNHSRNDYYEMTLEEEIQQYDNARYAAETGKNHYYHGETDTPTTDDAILRVLRPMMHLILLRVLLPQLTTLLLKLYPVQVLLRFSILLLIPLLPEKLTNKFVLQI